MPAFLQKLRFETPFFGGGWGIIKPILEHEYQ